MQAGDLTSMMFGNYYYSESRTRGSTQRAHMDQNSTKIIQVVSYPTQIRNTIFNRSHCKSI